MRSLLLIPLALTLSCADGNPSSMVILGNRLPGSGCVVDGNEAGAFSPLQYDLADSLPNGQINLGLQAFAIVKSLLDDIDDQEDDITFSYADVEIVATNYQPSIDLVNALVAAQQHRHSPPVEGGAVTEGGTTVASIYLITDPMRQVMAANFPGGVNFVQVEARVIIHGDVRGNSVESKEWRVPISIFPEGALINNQGDCCNIAEEGDETCAPFVTGVTCCSTSGETYCPSVKPDTCM